MVSKQTKKWISSKSLVVLFCSLAIITSCAQQSNQTPASEEPLTEFKPALVSDDQVTEQSQSLSAEAEQDDDSGGDIVSVQDEGDTEKIDVASSSADVLGPGEWKNLPVIPEMSERARKIYSAGIAAGNDPRAFAKVGDCQNVPSMFLSIFDYPGYFSLGTEYSYLEDTIDWYHGSFSRESEAVRRGFNAASVVSPVWADPEACEQGESPLECEIRINNPSVALISLETWWAGNPENYEKYVREIIEGLLEHDILPIVATKADNLEGGHQINEILVRLAMEYEIPIWNFWRAVQPLPGNGLMEDRFHLTFDDNHFDDEEAMQAAWPWRNLTALQVLDKVRSELAPTP